MRLTLATLFLILITASCGEKIYTGDVNCNECYTEEPESADLVIDLTINATHYSSIPVTVYEGDVEDNKIVIMDTAFSSPYYAYVPVDRKYAVKAEYKRNDATLFVIDGTKLKVKLVSDACDESCYVVENVNLDARIKNDFLDF